MTWGAFSGAEGEEGGSGLFYCFPTVLHFSRVSYSLPNFYVSQRESKDSFEIVKKVFSDEEAEPFQSW